MNKRQKDILQNTLTAEEKELKHLKAIYNKALSDINDHIAKLKGREDADLQHVIYQLDYQRALKGQINAILDDLNSKQFESISQYMAECYEDGFVGAMYDIAGQGIPIIVPIDQKQVIKAMKTDSNISGSLYTKLGEDTTVLKKRIANNLSRGFATGQSYAEMAKNIAGDSNVGFNKAARIARTEGARVYNTAAYDAQHKAKDKGADIVKQWDASLDGNTRPSHRMVDGEIKELDEKFSNGLMFPSDPRGEASEVINCRCTLLQRATWALDEDELETLKERAAAHGLDKTEQFEDFKKKYLKVAEQVANSPVQNKYGQEVVFDKKMDEPKWKQFKEILISLTNEYDTRLTGVKVGGAGAAGAVDMGGFMYLNSSKVETVIHEFAHSISMEKLTKFGVVDDSAFWKEIKAVKRAYHKDVGTDSSRWISSYEYSSKGTDEFLAEAFAHAKMHELGLEATKDYGKDLTYSNKVLEIVDKYFKKSTVQKTVENTAKSSIILSQNKIISDEKFLDYALNPLKEPNKAKAFEKALGYTRDNYQELKDRIMELADESKFVEKGDSGYGMRYEYIMEITGANGKKANVLTAWIQDGEELRLTSVYVTNRKVTE